YVFPNRKVTAATMPWIMSPNPLRTANLRAPYSQARCLGAESQVDERAARRLAAESQMDDMAAAAGIDPVEFRLRHLTGSNNERVAAVLRTVAKQAAWVPRSSGADLARRAAART